MTNNKQCLEAGVPFEILLTNILEVVKEFLNIEIEKNSTKLAV